MLASLNPLQFGSSIRSKEQAKPRIKVGVLIPFSSGLRFGRRAAELARGLGGLNPLQFGSSIRSGVATVRFASEEGLNPLQFGSSIRSLPHDQLALNLETS